MNNTQLQIVESDSGERVPNEPSLKHIFVSYRHKDSFESTSRIVDELKRRLYDNLRIFRDVDSIPAGRPFLEVINEALDKTELAVVIIGPNWLSAKDERGNRLLDDPNDFVRCELETAVKAGVHLLPVLVGNATMPDENELPPQLVRLKDFIAIPVRPDPDFHTDLERLINKLAQSLGISAGLPSNVLMQILNLETERNKLDTEILRISQKWRDKKERHHVKYGLTKEQPSAVKTFFAAIMLITTTFIAGGSLVTMGQTWGLFIIIFGLGVSLYLWSKLSDYNLALELEQKEIEKARREKEAINAKIDELRKANSG